MNSIRVIFVLAAVVILLVVIILRLIYIQINQHKYYLEIAKKQQNRTQVILAERGTIKDRKSQLLVYTKNDVDVIIDKRMLNRNSKKEKKLFEKLAEVFGVTENYYRRLIKTGSGNVVLEKKVPKAKILNIENFGVSALKIEENHTRVYPYGKLASHLLGYVNKKNIGISGIEEKFSDELKGKDGVKFIENDVIGRMITVKDNLSKNPQQGNSLVLTIDKDYQNILETYLSKGIEEFGAKEAVGIIMNPQNGEIMALANFPDYDPAKYNLADNNTRRNRAITDTYEPGSTMKPIVMSALIEEKLVSPNEVINTENGVYNYKNVKIRDSHKFNSLTVKGIIEQSSNIGMAKLSERIRKEKFFKYLRDFGFGNYTGININGEVNGKLKKPSQFTSTSKAFMSFGYEMAVTPIQLIAAYAALINGGILYKPTIIKKIESADGKIIKEFTPVKIRRVISEESSSKIKSFLIGAVENGTGNNAKVNGVKIGGKTGTSQRLIEGGYSKDEYNTSFVGFFPAENPQFLCLLIFGSPLKAKYGGLVAAPVFKNIVEKIIEIEPIPIVSQKKIKKNNEFVDKIFADITKKESNSSSNYSDNKETKETNLVNVQKNKKKSFDMPRVENLSARAALMKLKMLNLNVKIVGSGKVVSSSIVEGQKIKAGDSCVLYCKQEFKRKKINLN